MTRFARHSTALIIFLLVLAALVPLAHLVPAARADSQSTEAPSSPGAPCLSPSAADESTARTTPSATNVTLSGSVVPAVETGTAANVGSLPQSDNIRLTVVFSLRNGPAFQECAASIADPSSPNYRQFLDSLTLEPYVPTPGEKASVVSYLQENGFSVTDGASPLVVYAGGTVAAAKEMLGVSVELYRQGEATFYAPNANPHFPENFASMITGITGLDNYSSPRPLETPCGTSTNPDCPQGVQVGYSFSSLYTAGDNGAGEEVAVVDAPGDPNPQSAINTFDTEYGLPSVTLNIQYPDGTPSSYDLGWASETAMDIEAVHSVAPGAGIVLLYGQSTSDDLVNAIDYVATHHLATIVSNSWGFDIPDYDLPTTQLFATDMRLAVDAAQGLTILFASGDAGAYPDSILGVEFPASDPNVLAVGATNLVLSGCTGLTCTGYGSETGASISGGGYSGVFAEPSWQTSAGLSLTGRGVPDVSMLGYGPNFWVYSDDSLECGASGTGVAGWFPCAGTSLATPLWAGFLAVASQADDVSAFGNIDSLIYQVGSGGSYSTSFHDVTSGSNVGYSAGVGWDPVTGWGSPIASGLVTALGSLVKPAIFLSPLWGPTGTVVTVTGSHFSPSITIGTFTFGGSTPGTQDCTSQTTSSAGSFSCTFTVPSGSGTETVDAAGSDVGSKPGDKATTSFQIINTPYVDASASGGITSPFSYPFYTTEPNEVILIVMAGPSSDSFGTPTGSGLTFASRCAENGNGLLIQSFYAVSSGLLDDETISETFTGGGTAYLMFFSVAGADTSAPFDPNLSVCHPGASGTGTTASVSFTTTGTEDLLIGSIAVTGTSVAYTVGSGFSDIVSVSPGYDVEAKATSTAGLQGVTYSVSGTGLTWVMIGDALVTSSGIPVPDIPFGALPLILAIPVIYYLAKRVETSSLKVP